MKKLLIFVLFSVLIFSCQQKPLDISMQDNSFGPFSTAIWVNNNTGKDIEKIEYILNDIYFYTAKLPADGDEIDLMNFAAKDGRRFNYFEIKPLTIKAKANGAFFSINYDDIPNPEIVNGTTREVLKWSEPVKITETAADGALVLLEIVAGSDTGKIDADKAKKIISEIIKNSVEADFSVYKEDELQQKIAELLGVKDVRFVNVSVDAE